MRICEPHACHQQSRCEQKGLQDIEKTVISDTAHPNASGKNADQSINQKPACKRDCGQCGRKKPDVLYESLLLRQTVSKGADRQKEQKTVSGQRDQRRQYGEQIEMFEDSAEITVCSYTVSDGRKSLKERDEF